MANGHKINARVRMRAKKVAHCRSQDLFKISQQGPPYVAWLAAQFNLSPNYFGNLVKREIHITAHECIQRKIVSAAQSLLAGTTMNINEIAEELGFEYPNHFTRLFRRNTGMTPMQFRKGNT